MTKAKKLNEETERGHKIKLMKKKFSCWLIILKEIDKITILRCVLNIIVKICTQYAC